VWSSYAAPGPDAGALSLGRLEHAVKNRPGPGGPDHPLPLPDGEQRLLATFAKTLKLEITDQAQVLGATEGTTPVMLKEVVKWAAVERNSHPDTGKPLALQELDLLPAAEQVKALRDPEAVPGTFGFRDRLS
jgi:hypothetical protein